MALLLGKCYRLQAAVKKCVPVIAKEIDIAAGDHRFGERCRAAARTSSYDVDPVHFRVPIDALAPIFIIPTTVIAQNRISCALRKCMQIQPEKFPDRIEFA